MFLGTLGAATARIAVKTVELFSGIGGFRIAADQLALETVWANDVNDLACAAYRAVFGHGQLIQGDINALLSQVPAHDLLTAGFPCQPFSAAGKKLGVRDPRGTLFQSIIDVLALREPTFFVLENVKRLLTMEAGIHFATVLAALSRLPYFVEWRVLNAKHFQLAQNRERIVIVGHRYSRGGVGPASVRLLRSSEASQLSARAMALLHNPCEWRPLGSHALKFPNWGVAFDGRFLAHEIDLFADAGRPTLLRDVLLPSAPQEYDLTESTLKRLEANETVERFVNGVEILSNQSGGARMGYTIFGVDGFAPTLTASTSRHYERYKVGERYRRLAPEEYARLQGFPDDHCSSQRPYDQYALYGNAVPPPLVHWAMRRLTQSAGLDSAALVPAEPELFDAL
jgi:DNA (cytosine-5)-methyltransferase 1